MCIECVIERGLDNQPEPVMNEAKHTKDVTRYNAPRGSTIAEYDDGDFVLHRDYLQLERQLAESKHTIADTCEDAKDWVSPSQRIADLERQLSEARAEIANLKYMENTTYEAHKLLAARLRQYEQQNA
jgi:hypothetical protein